MRRQEQQHTQCLLCILLSIFFLYSCSREDKDVRILKKVSKDYVTTFSDSFKIPLARFKENTIVVIIDELDKNDPLVSAYPDYTIYSFFYSTIFDSRVERDELPSRFFYVKDYPVALYSSRLPPIKKSEIPQSVYRKPTSGSWVDDGCDWYVVICKKTHKYKVLPNPYLKPDSIIFGQGLKDFKCD